MTAAAGLPQLAPGLLITVLDESGAREPWFLVQASDRYFRVSRQAKCLLEGLMGGIGTHEELRAHLEGEIGQSLTPEDLRKSLAELPAGLLASGAHPCERRLPAPLQIHWTLLPETWVAWAAQRLRGMVSLPLAAVILPGAVLASTVLLRHAGSVLRAHFTGQDMVLVYSTMLLLTLWHELGHASASARFDCRPGRIGAGWYFLWPVFYTDVTRIWKLSARQRVVVDVGGIYFQAMGLCVLGFGAWLFPGHPNLQRAGLLTLFAILQSLNPFFKMDGYWLLTDLGGVTNLHGRVGDLLRKTLTGAPVPPRQRAILPSYVVLGLAYAAFLLRTLLPALWGRLSAFPAAAAAGLAQCALAANATAFAGGILAILTASFWPLVLSWMLLTFLLRWIRRRGLDLAHES